MYALQSSLERSYGFVKLLLILTSLAILAVMVLLVVSQSIKTIQSRLADSAQLVFQQTQEALHAGEHVLDSYRAYFSTVDSVDYRKLEEYSRAIRRDHPFIHLTQYMIRVKDSELDDFLNERRLQGFANFRITEYDDREDRTLVPVAERSVYYPCLLYTSDAADE
mgnify:FL=1